MKSNTTTDLTAAVTSLKQGGLIAYPTEAVYGLGCDPFNPDAVAKLYQLKRRPADKGFILIAASWQQLEPLLAPIPADRQHVVLATWPGPVTWVFPTRQQTSLAVRVTAHPIASALCLAFGGPLISTSANLSTQPPAADANQVEALFPGQIDTIIAGDVGDLTAPTPIYDALTGQCLREGPNPC